MFYKDLGCKIRNFLKHQIEVILFRFDNINIFLFTFLTFDLNVTYYEIIYILYDIYK